jgi:alpha-galactosidase
MSTVSLNPANLEEAVQAESISVVDDCWSVMGRRDAATGRIMPDPSKFPDGINGTAQKIHNLGLKIGIYSSK